MVYLDYAATAPVLPEVSEAMREAELRFFANASALHTPGHLADAKIEAVREKVAKLIGAESEEIIFTSSATEANNTVIRTFEGCEIETSKLEHPSVLEAAKIYGVKECFCGCGNCKKRSSGPKLYSYMLANNETGEILDIRPVIKRAHLEGGYFHSDLTQAFGKMPINVRKLGLDYATFSAHKIGGPVGVGVLYVRGGGKIVSPGEGIFGFNLKEKAPLRRLLVGGGQEGRRRAGTYNTAAIIGFGAAIDRINDELFSEYEGRIRGLRDKLAERILAEIPGSSLSTDLAPRRSLPNILNVSFRAAEGESIQLYLDAEGIIISTGSACAAGDGKPSHVLMAKTGDAEIAHSSVRFSFGLENSEGDIEKVMAVLPGIISRLQGMSTISMIGV